MNRLLLKLLLLLSFALIRVPLQAQLKDKVLFDAGIGLTHVHWVAADIGPERLRLPGFVSLGAGANFLLLQRDDRFSLGLNPNLLAGMSRSQHVVNFRQETSLGFMGSLPVYVLGRYGAGATRGSKQRFGVGVGLGSSITTYQQRMTLMFREYEFHVEDVRNTFWNPAALLAFSVHTRWVDLGLKAQWSLVGTMQEVTSGTYTRPFRMGMSSYGLSVQF